MGSRSVVEPSDTVDEGTPMLRCSRALVVNAGRMLAVSLACGCEGGSAWSELSDDVRMLARNLVVSLSPPTYVLDFEHEVGATECPQVLDDWTFENSGDAPVTVDLFGGAPALEIVNPNLVLSPTGGTADSTVRFTCAAPTDVDQTIQIGITREGGTVEYVNVQVRGTVR